MSTPEVTDGDSTPETHRATQGVEESVEQVTPATAGAAAPKKLGSASEDSATQGAASEHAASVVAEQGRRKPWWQHAWAIFAAVIAVIGAVTGVISIAPYIFRDATDTESLSLSVQPAESELAPVFAVPATTDWSTFPESTGACSVEQLAWFEQVGTRLNERYLVSVANTATEGATLSLKDFRGEAKTVGTPATAVAVVCDQSGTGGAALRAARLDPATGRTAVYAQADPSLPDNPLVFNLAPGESGEFALLIQSSADFEGDVVFTSALGGESWMVVLPIGDEVSVPGVVAQRLIVTEGGLACIGPDDCDPFQLIQELFVAAGGA